MPAAFRHPLSEYYPTLLCDARFFSYLLMRAGFVARQHQPALVASRGKSPGNHLDRGPRGKDMSKTRRNKPWNYQAIARRIGAFPPLLMQPLFRNAPSPAPAFRCGRPSPSSPWTWHAWRRAPGRAAARPRRAPRWRGGRPRRPLSGARFGASGRPARARCAGAVQAGFDLAAARSLAMKPRLRSTPATLARSTPGGANEPACHQGLSRLGRLPSSSRRRAH